VLLNFEGETMLSIQLSLSGRSEGKGRNGYFWITRAEASVFGATPRLRLDIYSKRAGDAPPLILELDQEDAAVLGRILSSFGARRTLV
jgi:hypothetical protein